LNPSAHPRNGSKTGESLLFASSVVKDHPLPPPPRLQRPGPCRARDFYDQILKLAHASESHELLNDHA